MRTERWVGGEITGGGEECEWLWRKEKRVKEGDNPTERSGGERSYNKDEAGREPVKKAKGPSEDPQPREKTKRKRQRGQNLSLPKFTEPIAPEKRTHQAVTRVEVGSRSVSSAIVNCHRRVCLSGRHLLAFTFAFSLVWLSIWGLGRGRRGREDIVSRSQTAAVDGTRERRASRREAGALGAVV